MNANEVKVGDILEYENNDYGILDIVSYGGIKYALANLMKNGRFEDDIIVFKLDGNTLVQELDMELLEILGKIFEKNLEKKIVENLKED